MSGEQALVCGICQAFHSDVVGDYFILTAACGHTFHRNCLATWRAQGDDQCHLCPNDMINRIDVTEWIKMNGIDPTERRIPAKVNPIPPDYTFKIVMLGGAHVGKTSLVHRYMENDLFKPWNVVSTIGPGDMLTKRISFQGKSIKLVICDTGGEERFRSLAQNYARNAHGALLVYSYMNDVTQSQSLKDIPYWMNFLRESGVISSNAAMILVGNKVDIPAGERGVTSQEGRDFAREHSLPLYETSAMDGLNVSAVFQALIAEMIAKAKSNRHLSDEGRAADGIIRLGQENDGNGGAGNWFSKTISKVWSSC